MKIFLGIVLALTCVTADRNLDDFIDEINSKQSLWTAGKNFNNTPVSARSCLLGGKEVPEEIRKTIPVMEHQVDPAAVPESFDARNHWPKCKTIREIRDQSDCGSCWAVAAASVISDRHCIHSSGRIQPEISARYIMACDHASGGCDGGYGYNALIFWRDHGVVTGGDYGSKIGCQPYPFPPNNGGSGPACLIKDYPTPKCVEKCDNASLVFNKELHYGQNMYRVTTEAQIQADIMKNGPVTAGMTVYDDFMQYRSGVYVPTAFDNPGGHIVRIIGWGVEKGVKYWLVANSWNKMWGEQGLFKIRRGVNTCGIEKDVYAGIPK